MVRKKPLHRLTYISQKRPKTTDMIPQGDYIVQEKMDGVRTELLDNGSEGRFINRRNVDKTRQYPEFSNIAKTLPGKNIIDGEVVAFNSKGKDDFKLLSERDHLKYDEDIKEQSKKKPLTFMAFDIMTKDGKDVTGLPWEERNKLLNQLPQSKHFKIVKTYPKSKAKEILKDKSIEGVVLKEIHSVYDNKKDSGWLKIKQQNDADVVITAYEEGKGKRKGMIGALHIGIFDGKGIKSIGKVGTGFNDKDGRRIKLMLDKIKTGKEDDVILVKPKMFAKVTYLKKGSKGALREPVFQAIRNDIALTDTHASKPFGAFVTVEKKGRKVKTLSSPEVLKLSADIKRKLKPAAHKLDLGGSIRRKTGSYTDVDLVMVPKNKEKVKEIIKDMGGIIKQQGDKKIEGKIKGVKVDVIFAKPEEYPTSLLYMTGPYGSNIGKRVLFKKKNMLLNQYGVWDKKTGKRVPTHSEADVYRLLKLPYKPPEKRGII